MEVTSRPLYPQGKNSWYPLDRMLGEPQSPSLRGGEEKNSQPPPRESNPRTPLILQFLNLELQGAGILADLVVTL
jgi:hypothetical protein